MFLTLFPYTTLFRSKSEERRVGKECMEKAARDRGMDPQAFTDEVSTRFRELARVMGFSQDDFIRTTEARHKHAVQQLWTKLLDAGEIYLGAYAGWYSVRDEAFYAESELVAGFHTEYSGMRFAMFFFAEYTNMLVVSMVATVLFLGGWDGPLLPGPVWFFLKTYTLLFGMIWVRWTWPRLRFDQLMRLCWGLLVPVAILNLLGAAVLAEVL